MAITLVNASHRLSTNEAKILRVRVPQGDAAGANTNLVFANASLPNLNAVPQEYFVVDVTPGGANLVTTTLSIVSVATNSITVCKTSAVGAALDHDFDVYLHTRRFYQ